MFSIFMLLFSSFYQSDYMVMHDFLEKVQPSQTGLPIPKSKRPTEYAKNYPQPSDNWPQTVDNAPPPQRQQEPQQQQVQQQQQQQQQGFMVKGYYSSPGILLLNSYHSKV